MLIFVNGIRYIDINLLKEVKDLHIENQKALLKETEEDTNEKICYVHESKELLKCPYYPKLSIHSIESY